MTDKKTMRGIAMKKKHKLPSLLYAIIGGIIITDILGILYFLGQFAVQNGFQPTLGTEGGPIVFVFIGFTIIGFVYLGSLILILCILAVIYWFLEDVGMKLIDNIVSFFIVGEVAKEVVKDSRYGNRERKKLFYMALAFILILAWVYVFFYFVEKLFYSK
jgi:hypothetical protein